MSLGFACFGFCLISCKAKNSANFSQRIITYWVGAIIVYNCFSLNTVYNKKFCTKGKKDFGTLIAIIHWMIQIRMSILYICVLLLLIASSIKAS